MGAVAGAGGGAGVGAGEAGRAWLCSPFNLVWPGSILMGMTLTCDSLFGSELFLAAASFASCESFLASGSALERRGGGAGGSGAGAGPASSGPGECRNSSTTPTPGGRAWEAVWEAAWEAVEWEVEGVWEVEREVEWEVERVTGAAWEEMMTRPCP